MKIQSKPRSQPQPAAGARAGRDNYRRKWKPTPPERRANAARSLTDVFRGVRFEWLVLVLLAVSLIAHALTVWLSSDISAGKGAAGELTAAQDSYLEKVLQKQKAKVVSRRVAGQITMPPPPPEPEMVVEQALADSLAGDVAKITGHLLGVQLQDELVRHVKANLKDELEAASKDIAQGKLTEEEIQALHASFQAKAHDMTVAWRQDYLEKHQVERAAVSTTEWYERDVSKTLFRNISFELWTPPGYNGYPPSPELWNHVYTGVYGWGRHVNWSDAHSEGMLRGKLDALRGLLRGQWPNAGGKDKNEHPAWPGPSGEQARIIAQRLADVRNGRPTETYPSPSWTCAVYGPTERPMMTTGLLREFHAHRMDQARAVADSCEKAWADALAAAEAYQAKADADGAGGNLAGARDACLQAIERIVQQAQGLLVKNPDQYRQVNWALRLSAVTGPPRDQAYQAWIGDLVAGLEPLVRDFARGQFKKGIIKNDAGIEQAMKEFPDTILPLLKRDAERMCSAKRFNQHVLGTVYPYRHYTSSVTGAERQPTADDAGRELAGAAKLVESWPAEQRAYLEARRKLVDDDFRAAITNTREAILGSVLTGNLLFRQMSVFVEGVDYADKVQERLSARQAALAGRGQDLARLTDDGVPDTSAPLVALMLGASKGHGANLQPVPTTMAPACPAAEDACLSALLAEPPVLPRAPAKWGFEEQAHPEPKFGNLVRYDAIPFLPKIPRLDGDLSDWGKVRPLILQPGQEREAVLLYAGWNYQGLFFGYTVKQPREAFYWPSLHKTQFSTHSYVLGASMVRQGGTEWAFVGDHLQVMIDTLDARNDNRGEPHTQEFVIFPLGASDDPTLPGIERQIASQRDATAKQYRRIKDDCRLFPAQPPAEIGPDGQSPYRVTRAGPDGYTCEAFIPRSLLQTPVFAPGWYIGFDCRVGMGFQGRQRRTGQVWATGQANRPDQWGDLLLLGTDPRLAVQAAGSKGSLATGIVPGGSYLLTVVDPDRNIRPNTIDTVLVSAEVDGGDNDVEVFLLNETKENSGVFRGYINTQPGRGRQVQGVLEVMPLQQVRLGYVDFANARGQRNVITEMKLPVVAPLSAAGN